MKNNFFRFLRFSAAIAALVIVAAAQNSIQAQDGKSAQSPNRIVGAWETTVTPTNCATGEPLAPAFHGVLTFNLGGTIAEYAANPATPYRTPGHGIWSGGSGGSYSMKFSFIPLTPTGIPIGRIRVSQDLELNRFSDVSTSSGGFVLTNFDGIVLGTGCSTAVAERLTF